MKINCIKTATIVFVDDAFKDYHYSFERPRSTVLRSKEIDTFGFGVEEYIAIDKKNYMKQYLYVMCSYHWW